MLQKRDNYALQAESARLRFLTYDQINMPVPMDAHFLHLRFCGCDYRICRDDGHIFRRAEDEWLPADSHGEALTIFDYLCDARSGRRSAGIFVSMASLGGHVHTGLASGSGPLERAIDSDPEGFRRACLGLGGKEAADGDLCFELELLPGLPVRLQFWYADEDFPPKLDLYWDKNALHFLRYETLWYAAGVLRRQIAHKMGL